jgi:uncharacterized membrane protein YfcA
MKSDRGAFAFGVVALAFSGLALWSNYGQIDWRIAGLLAPVCLVVIGVGMLLLTKTPN